MTKVESLMRFLAVAADDFRVDEDTYVVGGAVRNHLLGLPPKDLDIVVDSMALGKTFDSGDFARALQRKIPVPTNLTTNQYGVAILTIKGEWTLDGHSLKGEVIEIANARRESYGKGGGKGKGYKPESVEAATINEDLIRRDFTINTLMWRLRDLKSGPSGAPVLDLTGNGVFDLEDRLLRTPCDPDKTFTDDPTRMLRAVKFVSRYNLRIHPETRASIAKNAMALLNMPWDAVRKILVDDILQGSNPRESVRLLSELGLNEPIVTLLREEPGFHAGVSRGASNLDTLLLLDMWDLGWHLAGTPGGFLNEDQLKRLREILTTEPALGNQFMSALKKPPVNQERLFEQFSLKGRERAKVIALAREQLLAEPQLAKFPTTLELQLEALLAK